MTRKVIEPDVAPSMILSHPFYFILFMTSIIHCKKMQEELDCNYLFFILSPPSHGAVRTIAVHGRIHGNLSSPSRRRVLRQEQVIFICRVIPLSRYPIAIIPKAQLEYQHNFFDSCKCSLITDFSDIHSGTGETVLSPHRSWSGNFQDDLAMPAILMTGRVPHAGCAHLFLWRPQMAFHLLWGRWLLPRSKYCST